MAFRQCLFTLLLFAYRSTAKFQQTYPGIATEGVKSCIEKSSFTAETISIRQNCRDAFACVMESIPNQHQSILSSGSAILGFVPTVLLVLGNTNEDIIRIHSRYPLLSFFLSITCMNKRPGIWNVAAATRHQMVDLGPYGAIEPAKPTMSTSWWKRIDIVAVHALTGAGAALVTWQTVDMGRKAVLSWACWTDFYPALWLCLALIHHFLAVICMRLSSKVSHVSSTRRIDNRGPLLIWDLTQDRWKVECTAKKFARWGKVCADLLNNVAYLYGTVVFSSLTLVTGNNAIKILALYGGVAAISRITALWILEEINSID